MLYSEFLTGIEKEHSEGTEFAYEIINKMYMEDKLENHEDAYKYYEKNKSDFMWVDDLKVGVGKQIKKSPLLKEIISPDEAKAIINKEFGFEKERIIICATPYFEASDYNHIVFAVNGYERVFDNGELYDIYR